MRLSFTLFWLCVGAPIVAQETGLTFLRIGTTAREQAMANVGVASASGAAANYYNPALLNDGETSSSLLFSQNLYVLDTYGSFVAARFKGDASSWGVALTWLSVRDIPIRTRATTEPDGFFDAQNAALAFSYARPLSKRLSLAIAGKILYEKLFIDEASGYAADFSAVYRFEKSPLALAAAIQNVGAMNALGSKASKLPATLRAGAAYPLQLSSLGGALLLEGNIESVFSGKTFFNVGGEFEFRNQFWIRFGYALGNDARNFSGGVGARYANFVFDYAFIPFSNELGTANLLTLQVSY
ncbi:MAG: PorV/PorQ family protein [Chloroherpetonaceae bacterium]|nr:PorV/PorQ family protein [Chloroherpetonaceae bacterium]MDW8436720.1 PorV/PorQ family protein [Chloroherpetonaceae bacterium]